MADHPSPQQYATYPGDVRHMATNREVVGPNTLGFAYKTEVDRLAAATPAGPR